MSVNTPGFDGGSSGIKCAEARCKHPLADHADIARTTGGCVRHGCPCWWFQWPPAEQAGPKAPFLAAVNE